MKKKLIAVLTVSFLVFGAFGVSTSLAAPATPDKELPNEY
jgi:hypothetical protein